MSYEPMAILLQALSKVGCRYTSAGCSETALRFVRCDIGHVSLPWLFVLITLPFALVLHFGLGTGDSLSVVPSKPWVIVTPLALPGEKIRVRVYRSARLYSYADLLDVITPNPEFRDMSRVQCKYFGKCAGCQYQVSLTVAIPARKLIFVCGRCFLMRNSLI